MHKVSLTNQLNLVIESEITHPCPNCHPHIAFAKLRVKLEYPPLCERLI